MVVDPLASWYPFGSKVRLTAVPATGNYLAFWANAASGMTNNPLTFTVTNANPTMTAVFTALSGTQTNALTVIPNGQGQVTAHAARAIASRATRTSSCRRCRARAKTFSGGAERRAARRILWW